MTDKEIIQALRCTSTPGGLHEDCTGCPYYRKEQLDAELKEKLGVDTWPSCNVNKVGMDAADIIERLTAEVADLRKEIEWKDMVIALAQRKQAEAEAERDALLEYAKTMQECEMCKNDSFCHLRDPMKDDCKHCQRASDCPCQKCEENNCWEWRGLPEAPEGGEKA